MSHTVHAFDYLEKPGDYPPASVCVLFGDDPFLKRLALRRLRDALQQGDASDADFASFEGKTAEWRDVRDELCTVSLFGDGARLAMVEDADPFVSLYRDQLEDYIAKPATVGTLILNVTTWASNTRLYKMVDKSGLQIHCTPPRMSGRKQKQVDHRRLQKWITQWAKTEHSLTLLGEATELLLEIVGMELGLIDQSLAKLAMFASADVKVTPEMVRDLVGGWQTKTIWQMLDAATDGDAGEALLQLDHLLQSVDHPIALFGQISWFLRRFALATRIYEHAQRQRRQINLRQALEQAGFRKWPAEAMAKAEFQLKQLGRVRARKMYRLLLETDLALKGTHSTAPRARLALERLLVGMSKQMAPQRLR